MNTLVRTEVELAATAFGVPTFFIAECSSIRLGVQLWQENPFVNPTSQNS